MGRVAEAGDLRIAVGQVHVHAAVADRDGGADADVLPPVAVVVQNGLAVVGALGPGGDNGAGMALARVEDGVHHAEQGVRPVLLRNRGQPRGAPAGGAHHGGQVAPEVAGVAGVGGEHGHQVLPHCTAFGEADRRDPQPFLPDLGGRRVVAAMGGAADVALVPAHDGPEQVPPLREDRHEGGEVRQVAAAVVRVVEQEHVARHRLRKGRRDGAHGPGHGAHVDRDVVGLGKEAAARVGERDREVPGRVEDLGVRGSQHGLAHLLGDGGEPGLQDGDEHGIWHEAVIARAAAR